MKHLRIIYIALYTAAIGGTAIRLHGAANNIHHTPSLHNDHASALSHNSDSETQHPQLLTRLVQNLDALLLYTRRMQEQSSEQYKSTRITLARISNAIHELENRLIKIEYHLPDSRTPSPRPNPEALTHSCSSGSKGQI